MRNSLFLLLCLVAAPSRAQAPNVDRESQDRSRRGEPERKAAETAAQASGGKGDDIPFEAILKQPGDLDLNERFAREQIRRGDLRGAAITLERVLILSPDRARTRLLYAAVLYRLDALVDAERELRLLLDKPAPPYVTLEAKAYLDRIGDRRRKTRFEARLALGYGYDLNRNAAPESDRALFFGQPLLLDPASRRRADTYASFAGSLGVSREFGGAKPQKVFAGFGYYRGEQTLIDVLDLQAYSAHAGLGLRFLGLDVVPAAGFDHVLLSQSTYLRAPWQSLRVSRRLRAPVTLWAEVRREDQEFQRTRLIPNGADRSGDQYDAATGVSWVATPRDRLGASAGFRRKSAVIRSLAYDRKSLGVDYTRLLGRGVFASASATAQFDRYDHSDPFVDRRRRRADDALVTNVLVGAPLSLLWKPLNAFTATAGWERFAQHSNLENYAYTNHRFSALINYKWGI